MHSSENLNSVHVKKRRRRLVQSEWIMALQQSRKARSLRQDIPHRTNSSRQTANNTASILDRDVINVTSSQTNDEFADRDSIQNPELDDQHDPHGSKGVGSHSAASHVEDEIEDASQSLSTRSEQAPSLVLEQIAPGNQPQNEGMLNSPQSCAGQQQHPSISDTHCGNPQCAERTRFHADLGRLQFMTDLWCNPSTLSAMNAILGSVRYTVKQYNYSRKQLEGGCQHADEDHLWPSYYRIKRTFDIIRDSCLPKSKVVHLPKKGKPNQSGAANASEQRSQTEPVRVFYPTSWAKLDITTSTVFNLMFPDDASQHLDAARISLERNRITDPSRFIFVDHCGEPTQCGPGSVIRISAQRSNAVLNTPFDIWESQHQQLFDATIAAVWSVGFHPRATSSANHALNSSDLNSYEKEIVTNFSMATVPQESREDIIAGDTCTLLRGRRRCNYDEYSPVLIHRYWRPRSGMPSVSIIWARPSQDVSAEGTPSTPERSFERYAIDSVSLRRQSLENYIVPRRVRGKLADGTPYLIYRILLYCDDFQRSSSPSSNTSVGGCYFMPLALQPEQRRRTSSARLISLTPPGVSTNEVLHHIIDDLVHGTVCGVEGLTPSGERIRIFLDVVGFIGDYPASSGVTDVIGHTGRSPCTLCSFRRLHHTEAEGTRFGYTTNVHANNSAFLRDAERHRSLREARIPMEHAKILGMKRIDVSDVETWPLNRLCAALRRHKERIPLTDERQPVVTGLLDPYRCNIIAPDHLLTGLSKDVLNTVFKCLPTKDMQNHADILICTSLRSNGLLTQNEVYSSNKNEIHSMTLSELYCVMLVAAPCFRIITAQFSTDTEISNAVNLLTKLQRLIALTYWWPQREIDGKMAEDFVHVKRNDYFSELKQLSTEYVQTVDTFCARFEVGKKYLDKPNLHRMLELYQHSIPTFGHVREFMELIFESVHQHLKRSIEGSNNHEIQLFAVEQCVANDWQGRISSLRRETENGDPQRRINGRRGLRRMLLGPEADFLHEDVDSDFIRKVDTAIASLFGKAVVHHLNTDGLISNFAAMTSSSWKVSGEITSETLSKSSGVSVSVLHDVIKIAKAWINVLFPDVHECTDDTTSSIRMFKACKRVKTNKDGRQLGSSNGFDCLTCNNVVHVYVRKDARNEKVLSYHPGPESKSTFLIFVAALHRRGDSIWLICKRCSVQGDRIRSEGSFDKNSFQILCLTDQVRRVGIYHTCEMTGSSSECTIDFNSRRIIHSSAPLHGANMYFQRRINGYPPRVA